eukprot:GHVO01038690.1.p1 GENE.GHVO01038690.1~~GHVO01038690.1.p1  ORF type:complete len:288 (-),score=20.82 GHVO01038690.1:565-1401(-)
MDTPPVTMEVDPRHPTFGEEINVRNCDADGDSPLHEAILFSHSINIIIRIIERCLQLNRAILDAQNSRRQTPLHFAVINDNVPVIQCLVQGGCRLDLQDRRGNSALHMACENGSIDAVRALLPAPARPQLNARSSPDKARSSPDQANAVHLMNFKGETPLHMAASRGHLTIIRYLTLSHVGADVNTGDGRSGRTILHHAVEDNNSDVVYFIARHARALRLKVSTRSYDGFTAADLACDRRRHELYDLLKRISREEHEAIQKDDDPKASKRTFSDLTNV